MEQQIYNEKFSIGKILTTSWSIFIKNYKLIISVTILTSIPINYLLSFLPESENIEGFIFYMRVSNVLEGLIGVVSIMAIAYAIKNFIDGSSVSIRDSLKKSVNRWPSAIGTSIYKGILITFLTLLLIVPGIIYSVYWAFAAIIVVLCDISGSDALDYSKQIVKDQWWRVAGYFLVFFLINLCISFVVSIITEFAGYFLPDHRVVKVINDTILDIFFSYYYVIIIVFFINLSSTVDRFRIRKADAEEYNSEIIC